MTENTEAAAVEAIAGIIVRDVLGEDYDDLVEGYLDEILIASRRIMQLPAYAEVGKLFKERLDDAITCRDARIAELEGERNAALRECLDWAREAGLAVGKLEASEMAGVVEDWKARALKAEAALAKARAPQPDE